MILGGIGISPRAGAQNAVAGSGSAANSKAEPGSPEHSSNTGRKVKSKVEPEYPALAKRMNLSGRVKLEATVAADGHVVNTKVIGGNPLLVGAAADALKKWRYEAAPKDSDEIVEFVFDASN